MSSGTPSFDWNQLLPARSRIVAADSAPLIHAGKIVLITGAGGSIGSALVQAIAAQSPKLLILLDHSEQNLYEIETALSSSSTAPPFLAVLGDAGDRRLLASLFEENRPSMLYHAAAFKHVPLMEANPFAAIRNNALVTWNLARLAAEHRVPQLLLISTDKAANPRSIMGASKRLAELAILHWPSPRTNCRAIRLGNVLGSHGSVVPLFLRQIARGQNLTVTHKDVTRYFLTMDETVNLIFRVASLPTGDGLFLPEMGQPVKSFSRSQCATPAANSQLNSPAFARATSSPRSCSRRGKLSNPRRYRAFPALPPLLFHSGNSTPLSTYSTNKHNGAIYPLYSRLFAK